ncbi:MAG TPA: glycosyltransferase family 39 protein [Planctomycetota bacterium]|nr:glycosyltransferase family 39 protein [Planctomycetota bacterium]
MQGTPAALESPSTRFGRSLAILLLLDTVLVLSLTSRVTLWQIDEGRISEVSREMALTGDPVTPRMGGIPFACYPPLAYWLMAVSGSLFGWNEFAMRLPAALCGVGLVAIVALLARRASLQGPDRSPEAADRAGLWAGGILATIPGFVIQQKMCRADVMTLFFATFAFERFFAWATSPPEKRKRRDLCFMYLLVSVGVLAKGPLSIAMLGLAGLSWFIVSGQWRLLREMGFAWGIPLGAAIILPWYVLVYRSAGAKFLVENLLWENLRAFVDGYQQKQKWHFYLTHAPGVLVPWLLALGLAWKVRRTPGVALALSWFAADFLFLSASGAKRTSYVTYLEPPLAVASGLTLAACLQEAPILLKGWLFAVAGLLLVAGGILAFSPASKWTAERMQLIADLLPTLGTVLGGTAVLLAGVTWFFGPGPALPALAAITMGAILLYGHVFDPRWEYDGRSRTAFCQRARTSVPPETAIAVLEGAQMDGAYHFYVGRPLPTRGGDPGYYIVTDFQRDLLVRRGRRIREIDSLKDPRGRWTYFLEVIP